MKKFIGVIGNPQLDLTLLKRLEVAVVNNLEIKDAMRENYLQLPQDYVESFNIFKSVIDKQNYYNEKPKSKYHK